MSAGKYGIGAGSGGTVVTLGLELAGLCGGTYDMSWRAHMICAGNGDGVEGDEQGLAQKSISPNLTGTLKLSKTYKPLKLGLILWLCRNIFRLWRLGCAGKDPWLWWRAGDSQRLSYIVFGE